MLDLVGKLGYRGDIVAEVRTLAMIADSAIQAEDFDMAYSTSERMISTVLGLKSSATMHTDVAQVDEAIEVCWVACFQLGRHPEFPDAGKKSVLLARALELCPADRLHDVLNAWRRVEDETIEARKQRLEHKAGAEALPTTRKNALDDSGLAPMSTSLRSRLRDFHVPSPPLLSTPDAAALASRTFKSVAANFPFRGRSLASDSEASQECSPSGSARTFDGSEAGRVLSKGIGWLIGADED